MERILNWTGILISKNLDQLLNRNSFKLLNVRLSPKPYPIQINGVQHFPLYSILLAVNRTTIDYLRIGRGEKAIQILQTVPWNLVDIRALSVDFVDIGPNILRRFMKQKQNQTGLALYFNEIHELHLTNKNEL